MYSEREAMRYDNYQLMDFVNDHSFNWWVKAPDSESDLFWQTWIEVHPEKEPMVEQARDIILFLSFDTVQSSHKEQEEVKANIKRLIREETSNTVPQADMHQLASKPSAIRKLSNLWHPYNKIAAVFVGIVICMAAIQLFRRSNVPIYYTTSYGETRSIELPDGSTVMMNANSTLRYSNDWQQTHNREVWLTGEAFFSVRKKPEWQQARFIVHSDKLNVEVLGTKFNVSNRRGIVKVVLNSGKVKLNQAGDDQQSIVMQPKDLVEFSTKKQTFIKKVIAPEMYTSWRHHKLIFKETPVEEIAQVLEDTYGKKVIFKDSSLKSRRFTGSVPGQHIDLFLKVMAESMSIQITQEKQNIIIHNH